MASSDPPTGDIIGLLWKSPSWTDPPIVKPRPWLSPPTTPPTAEEYTRAGLPWFEYYDDRATALEGAEALDDLQSVADMGKEKGEVPLPENVSVTPEHVIKLRKSLKPDQVREGQI